MLSRLHIRNYAIISELNFELSPGLTIITGETGAGKSILLGALSLVLGKRADSSVLFDKNVKCVVEAHFDVQNHGLQEFFLENDLDFESPTILRREINSNGKSRAFVNDTPVNLNQLKALASRLIDIHSQHEVFTLKSADFRTTFLDSCADGGILSENYLFAFKEWKAISKEVELLKENLRNAQADQDYLQFQLTELEEFDLKAGELQENQDKLSLLENAEEITETLQQVSNLILNDEEAVVDSLRKAESELIRLGSKFPLANEWAERVKQSVIDLEDAANDMDQKSSSIENDPAELKRLEERVDEVIRLMTKHRKQSEAELVEYQLELSDKLNSISNSDEELTLLNGKLEKADSEVQKLATELTAQRNKTAKLVSPILTADLKELGMPDAELSVSLESAERIPTGQDKVEIKFTSNKGQSLQDISKVASGGELSRLMLSLKAEMADNTQLPAIIFDEIDTGVSGDVADKVGVKIKSLSSKMQVLCITHLPQIASKADQHYYVYKEQEEGRTVTGIRPLEKSDRIVEIAKMLSTANPTDAALEHAKNLVEKTA
ncbi:MAG: DNA repair protein RecN (Recombination protein N) [Bacteroidia bacterium]|jgi:DNA repair protein RecN (Recombination protein N)